MLKKSFVVFFVVVLLFPVMQNASGMHKSEIENPIFIQIKLYNSDGQFIGYNEGYPQILYLDEIINFLEPQSLKSTITIDGKNFEILLFQQRLSWSKDESYGQYILMLPINGNLEVASFLSQESFLVKEGDYADFLWTVFKPLN